jgi:hypothetical protein
MKNRNILFTTVLLVLACFGLLPRAQAVSPPPDGGYPGGNTAEGTDALLNLGTGIWNTALGTEALNHDTAGGNNTATGVRALFRDIDGSYNSATGVYALYANINGWYNNAVGAYALAHNISGNYNTANGYAALYSNTASYNTAIGLGALAGNTTGTFNIALGSGAGGNLTTGNSNIDIGNLGIAGESGTIRIGHAQVDTFIAGISGTTLPNGVTVVVDTNGHLGTAVSSQRFKTEIKPMDKASEAILALKPVTFHYKKEIDPKGIPQFGLVAEEVEKVTPALVTRDAQGKVYTVRYEAVNAMLLNEFLKEHLKLEQEAKTNQAQEATIVELKSTLGRQQPMIAEQQKEIQALAAAVREQAAQIHKVSAQIETRKLRSAIVFNDQ